VINGSFWLGAAMGATASIVRLIPPCSSRSRLAPLFHRGGGPWPHRILDADVDPDSPRWLMIPCRPIRRNAIVDEIEHRSSGQHQAPTGSAENRLRLRDHTQHHSRRLRIRWFTL